MGFGGELVVGGDDGAGTEVAALPYLGAAADAHTGHQGTEMAHVSVVVEGTALVDQDELTQTNVGGEFREL